MARASRPWRSFAVKHLHKLHTDSRKRIVPVYSRTSKLRPVDQEELLIYGY